MLLMNIVLISYGLHIFQIFSAWPLTLGKQSGMADHVWKEKRNHQPLWDKVKIIDREEHWRIRHLKVAAHMLCYSDLLSRPSIEINTIWESIIRKA